MLERINPEQVSLRRNHFIPPFLTSLIAAAKSGHDLLPYVESITRNLGFDCFSYGAATTPHPNNKSTNYVYTTMSDEWMRRYEQMAYIEVDPRIILTCKSAIPLVWDQKNVRGRNVTSDAFLDDALRFGIASGVCFMFHGPHNSHVIVALDSAIKENDDIRHQAITRNLPDILMFGHYFHEIFMRSVTQMGAAPKAHGVRLSNRERECLSLAVHGMTTEDIAIKLEIKARTVQFHFDSIRTKLGAANRQEAIALAVQSGVVSAY